MIPDQTFPAGFEMLDDIEIREHSHLAVAAAYCRRLGIVDVVDRMVPTRMELRPGLTVLGMVLDTLSGRSPLYRLEQFLAGQDAELLLGEQVDAHDFNDTNLGRSLDAIFKAGPSKIITELGIVATRDFKLDTSVPSYDTTSTSVWGDYAICQLESHSRGPKITHGHSKDNLPNAKQFMTELLCVGRGVPIFGGTLDGNSSDKTSNNKMLSRISAIMARHGLGPGAFVYVADSAMVTKDNLEAMESNLFVSRLPANYSACARVIAEAVDKQAWIHIGKLAEHPSTASRPCAEYKAFETSVDLHEKTYRAVVIHSSSHDRRRRKKLEKTVAESARLLDRQLKTVQTVYFCEADALRAAQKIDKLSTRLHTVATTIAPVTVRKRGRPPKDAPPPTTTRYKLTWQLVENTEGIAREKALAGCFALLTNVSAEEGALTMDARKLLQTYKGQYGVESDFAFLKDPLVVNDIFLKKPTRIEVLGMVLIIALMVWRLMERSMRNYIENSGKMLPGWDGRITDRPTSFMMTTFMKCIKIIIIKKRRYLHRQLNPEQLAFLDALGLGPPVFTDPTCCCQPIMSGKSV